MRRPQDLFQCWDAVRARVSRAQRIFLFFDFDGTLAPIRSRPEEVWLSPDVRRLLRKIQDKGVMLAIISGRKLGDVRKRAALPGIWYAGEHGFFVLTPNRRTVSLLTASQRSRIKKAQRTLLAKLGNVPGIQVELKQAAVAVHYRRAASQSRKLAFRVVREVIHRDSALRVMAGKKVWEILPATSADKWNAAKAILEREKWWPSRDLLFYFGDDTTDESIFRKMRGISVAVGKRQGTAAKYCLQSPREVKGFLMRWDELTKNADMPTG